MCGKIKYMKKNIKSVFVVLSALVLGLSINYLYSAYGPTAPAPGLPSDLPVITEIYKTDGTTNYWQEKGTTPAGGGITGSLLDVSDNFKLENLLIFKNLVVGTPNFPSFLSINALTPASAEQNVCSITAEGKIILCDQVTPQTPTISITQTGANYTSSCNPDIGDATIIVTNPTPDPMTVRYLKYYIGYDVYTGQEYNSYFISGPSSWVQQTVNSTQPIYTFTTPLKQSCFLSYDSVILVEVTINGQVYADSVAFGISRYSNGGSQCDHCDPGYNPPPAQG